MRRRLRTLLAAGVTLLCLIGTAGCALVDPEAAHCSPRFPETSDHVVRAGQVFTVSVSASTCAVRFSDDRRLTLTAVDDRTQHRFPLGTVTAYPSGAFEKQVRLPTAAPTGSISIFVDGVQTYCAASASCAAYAVNVIKVDTSPDFATDQEANAVAARIASSMEEAVGRRPSLVQLAVVSDGVEATLYSGTYGRETAVFTAAFANAQAAAPSADRAIADAAQLHLTTSWNSRAQLDRLNTRITRDGAWLQNHRLDLARWGPDPATGTVRITLSRYTDADAVALTERYGDAVSVSTRSISTIAD